MDAVMTAELRAVLDRAGDEALALRHQYIGTEHLLLALAERGSEPLGVDPAAAIERVHAIVGPGQRPVDAGVLPYTPRSKRVLVVARRAAKDDGAAVGSGHLLAALANEPDGVASRVLAELS